MENTTPAPATTAPTIPDGSSSKWAKVTVAILALLAAVTAVADGSVTEADAETLYLGAGALVTLLGLIGSKAAQAVALIIARVLERRPTVELEHVAGELIAAPATPAVTVVNNLPPGPAASARVGTPDLDLSDADLAAVDGDHREPAGGPPIDEAERAPDLDVEADAR